MSDTPDIKRALTWFRVHDSQIFLRSTPVEVDDWMALMDQIPLAAQLADEQRLARRRNMQWNKAAQIAGDVAAHMVVLGTPVDSLSDAITVHVDSADRFSTHLQKYSGPAPASVSVVGGYRLALIDLSLAVYLAVPSDPWDDQRPVPPDADPDAPQWTPPLGSPPASTTASTSSGTSLVVGSTRQDTTPLAPVMGLFPAPAPAAHVRVVPPRLTRGWRR